MSRLLDSLGKLLAFDEGCRLIPYKDSKGIWTIGIGHNLEANGVPPGIVPQLRNGSVHYPACMAYLQEYGISDAECEALFAYDLGHVTGFLDAYGWMLTLDACRSAAIHDMAFNLGQSRFLQFGTFIHLMSAGQFAAAAADLRTTPVYKQLPTRYERLAKMLETGDWPSV